MNVLRRICRIGLIEWLPSLLVTSLGVAIAFVAPENLPLLAAIFFAAAPALLVWPTRNWSGPWAYLVLYFVGIAEFLLFGWIIENGLPSHPFSGGWFPAVSAFYAVFSVSAISSFLLRFRVATDRLLVSIGEKITILLIVTMTYLPINALVLYVELTGWNSANGAYQQGVLLGVSPKCYAGGVTSTFWWVPK